MEVLRQWAFGVCAASIACGLVRIILPSSGMQRIFTVTASVFFLCCLLSPVVFTAVLPGEFDLQNDDMMRQIEEKSSRLQSAVQEQNTALATESLRAAAAAALADMGVEYQKIYINVHDDGMGSISISECEVQLDQTYFQRHDEIHSALQARLGVTVRIGYKEAGS